MKPSVKMEAIVLAGGLGSRLRAVVSDRPKPMAVVGDRPFLSYLLDLWLERGVGRFIFSVGFLGDLIQSHFGACYRGARIDYVFETSPLGTGGGLLLAARKSRALTVLVLNGDTFFDVDLDGLLAVHYSQGADLTLGLRPLPVTSRYGVVSLESRGEVRHLDAGGGGPGLVNAGVYCLKRSLLRGWELEGGVSLEREMIPAWLDERKALFGYISEGRFLDIGTPQSLASAPEFFGLTSSVRDSSNWSEEPSKGF